MKTITQKPIMISTGEAAAMFSVASGTLCNWRSKLKGPRFYRINRKILYRVEDLDSYFSASPILTTDSLPEGQR